jgi:2',3'-cyclic-nucleotide 2'-phosphodiesterase (5'-nucleotidase family)
MADRAWSAALVGAVACAGVAACNGCHAVGLGGTSEPKLQDAPPTLRVYFVSDLGAAIEPCGCVKDQLGGLDHAAAWIAAERPHAPSSFLVAAGPTFFMDSALDPDHRSQDIAKAEALATALRQVGLAGWAPATNDWAGGAQELGKLALLSGAPGLEVGVRVDAGAPLLPTSIVPANGLRVALIGVGPTPGPGVGAQPSPVDAVRAASQAARAQGANLVIVLATVGRGEAKRIADAVPDLTAIIVGDAEARGDANTPSPPAEQVGNVLIAETSNHLQAVGAIDFYVRGNSYVFADAAGLADARKAAEITRRIDELHVKIANWERDRSIAAPDLAARRADLARLEAERARLDIKAAPAEGSYFRYTLKEVRDSLGQDPAVKSALQSYYRVVNEANRVQFADRVPPAALPGQPAFLGVEACRSCHVPETRFWEKTGHAGAYATLSTESKEFNLDCVSCHVTGYGRAGGSTVTHVDRLKNVQCEACHGPGSLHAEAPKTVHLSSPGPDACLSCHHPPHVEGFDAVGKMMRVVGPGHGG